MRRLTLDAIAIRTIGNGNTSSNNIVRHNQCVGFTSGVVLLPSGTGSTVTGNLIEGNALLFNEAGVGVGAGATGNVIRRNQVFDNGLTGAIRDIQDNNAAGANTYQNNLCDGTTGTGAAGVCPNVPNFAGHENVSTSQTVANQQ